MRAPHNRTATAARLRLIWAGWVKGSRTRGNRALHRHIRLSTGHFLEYVDWANALVGQPLVIADGHAVVPERPGNGMVWDKTTAIAIACVARRKNPVKH